MTATTFDALGAGTDSDPHLLCTTAQLLDLMQRSAAWTRSFRLGMDLDLAGNGRPIGTLAMPFTGVFDGDGHVIRGFTYVDPTVEGVGLFAAVHGVRAEVRDLRVLDATATGKRFVGALAGVLTGGAMISNCGSTGTVASAEGYVGGLVGLAGAEWVTASIGMAVISASWSSATVGQFMGDASATSAVSPCASTPMRRAR